MNRVLIGSLCGLARFRSRSDVSGPNRRQSRRPRPEVIWVVMAHSGCSGSDAQDDTVCLYDIQTARRFDCWRYRFVCRDSHNRPRIRYNPTLASQRRVMR
jgi:hypothetical protein